MRTPIINHLIASILVIFGSPHLLTAAQFDVPHISVYGTATTEVVPDLMNWQIGVRTTGKSVPEVASEHDQNVAAVLKFLEREEIKEKDIQTSQLQLAEDVEYRGGTRIKKGYYASTSIAFQSKTMEAYRDLWIGLSKLDAVSVGGVSFDTSKRIKVQDSTRQDALKAARSKARDLAASLGMSVGTALLIEEQPSAANDRHNLLTSNRMSRVAADASVSGPSLSVGTIPIKMRMKAIFGLIGDTP